MADDITAAEYLEVNDVPLATPAWRILDLSALFGSPALRGSDDLIPGVAGVIPNPRRITVTTLALPMAIFGERDREGVAHPSVREGLMLNIDELLAQVAEPATGDGTVEAVWHRADGGTLTADVHVLGLPIRSLGPTAALATLQLSIPQGRFTA